ncbi:uncharacterized protein B0T15DRAFT_404895 [Chaetomium strumarium]|uniref:Zn(2)-C6 fungal-type domain-containing protein n=1 Tax=Chaetomium strumarium TaxID=1170767 RepID=A0AAJ0LXY6_9PEZI|nr:hypothetical protein B0T15DRAFT_404895 [Chaetomium strumarium]
MSTDKAADTAKPSPDAGGTSNPKPPRVYACVLCQKRKIKCDRVFPCSNCTRSKAICVASRLLPRQRRRRFPERELLERIRHYEDLLRQHHVRFEPLHPPAGGVAVSDHVSPPLNVSSPDAGQSEAWSVVSTLEPKNCDAEDDDTGDEETDSGFLKDGDDLRGAVITKAWDHLMAERGDDLTANGHHLLFGSPPSQIKDDLAGSHPPQAQIFQLWQIYLDNVNPLFKVTHTPTLQTRIVNAISDLTSVSAPLEALMFSIYSVSLLAISEEHCRAVFGSPKEELMARYQFACRQALVNCRFLHTGDHDCLVALYLYLVSMKSKADPRSVSSMMAIAIRTAQRMGYHSESSNAKCNPLEAELRRRLWWSLVIFDNRVCEVVDYKPPTLAPTWDCRPPMNLNDFELRAEAKSPPPVSERPSEALFAVVRSEISDFIRHSAFHLDYIDPLLTTLAEAKTAAGRTSPSGRRNLPDLQRTVEEMLRRCDPQNPLHFMTMWMARGFLARIQLLEYRWRRASLPAPPGLPDPAHDPALAYACTMLDCDTKLMTSPLIEGFVWHIESFYFPFVAYAYILQRLKKQPNDQADRAWESMSDNYEARRMDSGKLDNHSFKFGNHPFFVIFARMVMVAWEAREAMLMQQDITPQVPRIVARVKSKMEQRGLDFALQSKSAVALVNLGESAMPRSGPLSFAGTAPGASPFGAPTTAGFAPYPDILSFDMDSNFMSNMTWGMMQGRLWS